MPHLAQTGQDTSPSYAKSKPKNDLPRNSFTCAKQPIATTSLKMTLIIFIFGMRNTRAKILEADLFYYRKTSASGLFSQQPIFDWTKTFIFVFVSLFTLYFLIYLGQYWALFVSFSCRVTLFYINYNHFFLSLHRVTLEILSTSLTYHTIQFINITFSFLLGFLIIQSRLKRLEIL